MPKKPSIITANEIYEEAQASLRLADVAYTKVYNIRRSLFQVTSGFGSMGIWGRQGKPSERQAELIKKYSRESSKHRAKHKRLMAKLAWDSDAGVYRLRG